MGHRLIPGPSGGGTLQSAYDKSAAIITAGNGPVALSRTLVDSQAVLTVDKAPTASAGGAAISVTMGANATGAALEITNGGTGPEISWGNNRIEGGSVILEEKAAPLASSPGLGQIYVKDDAPNSLWFRNDDGDTFRLDVPTLAYLGTPTYSSLQDMQNTVHSAGQVTGGGITDDADGTITVAAGTGLIRSSNSPTADMFFFDWAAESGALVALVDNSMNYVYVEYNAGSPRVVATNSVRDGDKETNILLGTVYREGTTLHISENNIHKTADHAGLMLRRMLQLNPFAHVGGGVISETGTRNIALTAGSWWHGISEFTTAAFDTSVSDTFVYAYRDGVGGWTTQTAQTQISNTQYDDGSGTLASLTGSKFGVHWVYLEQDGDVYVLYGWGDYTITEATDAGAPSTVPPWFDASHAKLVGKIIIGKDNTTFTSIESPFATEFSAAVPTDHGSLVGLADDDHTQYILADGTRAFSGQAFLWSGGSQATPGLAWDIYTGTGLRPTSATQMRIPFSGSDRIFLDNTYIRHHLVRGSAAAPAYQIYDANSGIYSPAASQVAVSTGGVLATYWDAAQAAWFASHVHLGNQQRIYLDDSNLDAIYSNSPGDVRFEVSGTSYIRLISNYMTVNVHQQILRDVGTSFTGTTPVGLALAASVVADVTNQTKHSPNLGWKGYAWNTSGTPASEAAEIKLQLRMTPGATTSAKLMFRGYHAGGSDADFGYLTPDGDLALGDDTDRTVIFGRTRIDNRNSDIAHFSHYARPAVSDYAIRQLATGQTNVNSVTNLYFGISNVTKFQMTASGIEAIDASGGSLRNEVASSSNPTLVPNRSDVTTGMGASSSGEISLITGGVEALRLDASQNTIASADVILGLNQKLVMDDDLDTYIQATADDQLRIYTLGAARMLLTTSAWTAFVAHNVQLSSLGTSLTGGQTLLNTTAASAGAQQYSPAMILRGEGWKTAATASTQYCQVAQQVRTVQGTANPTIEMAWSASIENVSAGAYADAMVLYWDGSVGDLTLPTGDLDAAGGFRRMLQHQWLNSPGTSTTYNMRMDGTLSTGDSTSHPGWMVPARAGSVVELSVWVDADVAAGQIDFWVQKSTDGGDTWSDLWGSSGSPIASLDSATKPEVNFGVAAKDTYAFSQGDMLRIKAATDASFSSGRSIYAAIAVEC